MVPSSSDIDALLANRRTVFQAVRSDPRSKTELEDSLDCSRSTIDRAVRELRDAGLVRYADQVWEPTSLGTYAYRARRNYLEYVRELTNVAPLLGHLPGDSPLSEEILQGATVHAANAETPDLVLEQFLEYVTGVTCLRFVTPALSIGFAKRFYERATASAFEFELIATTDVFERASDACPDLTASLLDDERVELRSASVPFSFGLSIADADHAGVLLFTDHGIRGLIVNDSPAALAWAENRYEQVRRSADRVTL